MKNLTLMELASLGVTCKDAVGYGLETGFEVILPCSILSPEHESL
jgi:hypothetical protein